MQNTKQIEVIVSVLEGLVRNQERLAQACGELADPGGSVSLGLIEVRDELQRIRESLSGLALP